jgi:hypothetical protein
LVFQASGVVGNDVVQLLRQACQRRGDVDIDVVAALNDTTGTMLACSFLKKHCYIGVIVGTGVTHNSYSIKLLATAAYYYYFQVAMLATWKLWIKFPNCKEKLIPQKV